MEVEQVEIVLASSYHHKLPFSCKNHAKISTVLTRGPSSPKPKTIFWDHPLLRDAKYYISYEKRFQTMPLEKTRYFVKDITAEDNGHGFLQWLEVPEYMYNFEYNFKPFIDAGVTVKFACDNHPGYLFVVRTMLRCKDGEEPVVVERRGLGSADREDLDDGQYHFASFGPPRDLPAVE